MSLIYRYTRAIADGCAVVIGASESVVVAVPLGVVIYGLIAVAGVGFLATAAALAAAAVVAAV